MNNIVKVALRELILQGSATRQEVSDALDELISGSIVRVAPGISFADVTDYRRQHGRIESIKFARATLGCGLLEALVIIKGIESHYDIPSSPY